MATSSSMTWVVASTGKSTSVGPNCSSAQSSSSPVVAQPPAVESSIRASTTCAWLIVSELAPLPIWIAALMPDPAGTATPEAPLVVTDRLTGCDVLGAVASQAVNVSATGASHSAPRTRDRSIIRTSPKGDVSTIVPSSGSNAPAAACEPYHFFAGRWRSGSPVVTPTASSKDCAEAQGSVAGYPRTSSAATVMVGNRSGVIVFPRDTARWLVKLRGSHGPASSAGKPATRRLPVNW